MSFRKSRSSYVRLGDESLSDSLPTVKQRSASSLNSNEDATHRNLGLKNTDISLKSKVLRNVFSEDYDKVKNRIFDPRGQTIRRWNRVFLTACLVCLFVDPLFFYVPSVDGDHLCLYDGQGLKILLTIVRSVADAFYIVQIIVRFNTAFVAPSSRVFGRGELVIDSTKIAFRYLCDRFWIDLYAALPLPQVLIWAIIPNLSGSTTTKTKNVLLLIIILQYLLRLFLLLPLRLEISNAGGGLARKAWARAAFNLMLYLLASHVSGACWYLLSVGRQESCWRMACNQEKPSCQYDFFDCHHVQDPARVSWYGSTNLIGNMQEYLQAANNRIEQWRLKKTDTEQWMQYRHLPPQLRQSVRTYYQSKWVATRYIDEESLLRELPVDLHRNVKRHLCFDLVRRVPLFNQMDERMLDAICERLKPVLCTGNMYLVHEGDPIQDMFFIFRGHLNSSTTNGGRTGFFNSCRLGPGDFCGEELLTWALDPRPSIVLPSSTRTVKALKEVEAFSLAAEDLKFVASQFRRLHSKELRNKFRFYSHQWRTWAACFIQSTWRRYRRSKEEAELREDGDGRAGNLKPSRSFWDVYARELIKSTRRDEKRQAGSSSEAVNVIQKPVDLDFGEVYEIEDLMTAS
ncbi:hypothetical protein NL676_004276 [Syzygium grande]|nr:hypothetical protein NL676_004276 [Syzygium grande]